MNKLIKKQEEVFLASEGNAYHKRNWNKIRDINDDPIFIALKDIQFKPKSILEIGCGYGWRVGELSKIYSCKAKGIDPSTLAIKEGKKLYPNIDLSVGTAANFNKKNDKFDLVIFGFCLYLCDPEDLFTIAANINNIITDRGLVVIFDFYSKLSYTNDYKYFKGIKSHKMDYTRMFSWHPFYTLIYSKINRVTSIYAKFNKLNFNKINPNDYVALSILLKNTKEAYFKSQS